MEKLLSSVKNLFLFKCSHKAAFSKNYRYCPDCGKKLYYKWIIIKCKKCGHYRTPAIKENKEIMPDKRYCFYCGSDKWTYYKYYEETIPESLKLISSLFLEEEEKYNFGSHTKKTKVWVSMPQNSFKKNI